MNNESNQKLCTKTCVIVGSSYIPEHDKLKQVLNVDNIFHIDGNKSKLPTVLPKDTKYVIVYTRRVGHTLMRITRKLAKKSGATIIYLKTGFCEILSKENNINTG